MIDELLSKKKKIAVIGLGYVGLPVALEFAKKVSVIGFDINEKRINMLRNKKDPSAELSEADFNHTDIVFTSDMDTLLQANFFIIAVPTSVEANDQPDMGPLFLATITIGKILKKGDYIVYESTVYPGCTEEDCVPILEKESGLTYIDDFKVGYSPERINPGDKFHTLTNTSKIVSACDGESLEQITQVYELIINKPLHKTSNIKVAETAKIFENTQRDINIALMNELSLICNQLNISTYDVIDAATTKWNFLNFSPGLVGGSCIGIGSYYLSYKAKQKGYDAQLIDAGRRINDSMGSNIVHQIVKKLLAANKHLNQSRVLVMGFTFKEDVADIRNSKVADIIHELQSYKIQVDVIDPFADVEEVEREYGIMLKKKPWGKYDAIVITVAHSQYKNYVEQEFLELISENGILIDIKGIYRNKFHRLFSWSL